VKFLAIILLVGGIFVSCSTSAREGDYSVEWFLGMPNDFEDKLFIGLVAQGNRLASDPACITISRKQLNGQSAAWRVTQPQDGTTLSWKVQCNDDPNLEYQIDIDIFQTGMPDTEAYDCQFAATFLGFTCSEWRD